MIVGKAQGGGGAWMRAYMPYVIFTRSRGHQVCHLVQGAWRPRRWEAGLKRMTLIDIPRWTRGAWFVSQKPRASKYCTWPSCPSFKRAFSAPVLQVALGTRRTAQGRRRKSADSLYFTILSRSPSSLNPRLRACSTQRVSWLARHSIWPAGETHFLSVLCAPLFVY